MVQTSTGPRAGPEPRRQYSLSLLFLFTAGCACVMAAQHAWGIAGLAISATLLIEAILVWWARRRVGVAINRGR